MDRTATSNYNVTMKTTLIPIGNSRGIRIPKPVIQQCGFTKEVDMVVRDHEIVIRSAHPVREGWEQSFKEMAKQGEDRMIDRPLENRFDDEEWEWK